MKKNNLVIALLFLSLGTAAHSLEALYDTDLQDIDGQAGADLSFYLSLNQKPLTGAVDNALVAAYDPARTQQFDTSVCQTGKLEYCRLAIVFNNRTVDASGNPTGNNTGKKQWITFKGVQGTIYIPRLGIDGATVNYMSKTNTVGSTTHNSTSTDKPAVLFSFDSTKPIQIRNLGFMSLAIETDTVANEGSGNLPGYLDTFRYATTAGAFDANNPFTGVARERGFLGVNINTNLQIAGSVRMFSCASSDAVAHPRC